MTDEIQRVSADEAERVRRAWDKLANTLTELTELVESKKHERCPYRTAKDECTFRGGCTNKRRQPDGRKLCGGDHKLRREQSPR